MTIDPETGSLARVGDIGIENVNSLAFMNSILYGTAGTEVFPVDLATGEAGTPVGYDGGFGTTWGATGPPVPEPGTLVLVASGLLGLAAAGRKKRAVRA